MQPGRALESFPPLKTSFLPQKLSRAVLPDWFTIAGVKVNRWKTHELRDRERGDFF
jgi:hypothetical protein